MCLKKYKENVTYVHLNVIKITKTKNKFDENMVLNIDLTSYYLLKTNRNLLGLSLPDKSE